MSHLRWSWRGALGGLLLLACQRPDPSSGEAAPSASTSAVASPAESPAPPSASPSSAPAASSSSSPAVSSSPAASSASAAVSSSSAPASSSSAPRVSAGCYEQQAQPFLIRGSYYPAREHREEHAAAIKYRAEKYGEIPKLTPKGLNAHKVQFYTETITWMGQSVQVHRKITPALRCVEREIFAKCGGKYRPQALAGYRTNNTYHQGEITNHLFGIAIDVDPHRNPCCHCIEPWSNHPRCGNPKASPYEHMEMPRCWVEVFERFGFYWLGHDRLEDTMHFEFLGDPGRIVAPPPKRKQGK